MPDWLIDVLLGIACGVLGAFPGWKVMYRAAWSIAQREGYTLLRHLRGFPLVAWLSAGLGGVVAAWTGVPWWSLLCGLFVGGILAALAWARHLLFPMHADDDEPARPDQ